MKQSNLQRLGNTLSDRMKATAAAASPVTVELGTIGENLSLTTDSLQSTIPKGEYMVNLMLTGGTTTSTESHTHDGGAHEHSGGDHEHSGGDHTHTGEDHEHSGGTHAHDGGTHTHAGGDHEHSGGDHSHELPDTFRDLQEGDRVLVVWCGHEPVVVAIVVSS